MGNTPYARVNYFQHSRCSLLMGRAEKLGCFWFWFFLFVPFQGFKILPQSFGSLREGLSARACVCVFKLRVGHTQVWWATTVHVEGG